jgi:Asp-tRNA(Asn)/Glu-tRNA(Gln) amidotransferase A subunit family amidase
MRDLVDTEDADPRVIALFEAALDDLRRAGATIVDPLEVPTLKDHLAAEYFCPRFRYDMAEYLKTLGEDRPISDVREAFDAGTYSPYVKETFAFFLDFPADVAPDEWQKPCPTYPRHPGREAFYADLGRAMDAAGVEALLYPTWTNVPAPLDRGREEYKGDNSQLIAPATGMPAVTIPMGFVESEEPGRVWPAGLQMVAARYEDHQLFRFAYAYEQATRHRRPPPNFPPLSSPR